MRRILSRAVQFTLDVVTYLHVYQFFRLSIAVILPTFIRTKYKSAGSATL